MGFEISWGYWTSNSPGNAAVLITLIGYLTYFLPMIQSKQLMVRFGSFDLLLGNFLTFIISSAILWTIHFLMYRGTHAVSKINFVATVAKIIGFIFFIAVVLIIFQTQYLHPFVAEKVLKTGEHLGLYEQMNRGALLTLWAFIGIESAVWLSGRAKNLHEVKRATIAGLFISLAIYLLITIFAMGALPQQELMTADKPLVDVLTHIIGPTGSLVMAALGVLSMAGAAVGWILLSVEVPYQSAKLNLFPLWFVKENKNGAPLRAAWVTNGLTQVFLISTLSDSIANAFNTMIVIATLANLVPYLFAAIYSLVLTLRGESYEKVSASKRFTECLIAALAAGYSIWVLKSGLTDLKTLGLGMLLILSGLVFVPLLPKVKC